MRKWICVMLLLANMITLTLRSFLSMSIILMVRSPESNASLIDIGKLDWPQRWIPVLFSIPLLGWLASSLILFLFLSNWRHEKFSVLVAILLESALTIAMPSIAEHSFAAFAFARFFLGFGEGFVIKSLNVLIANWFPPAERIFAVAIFSCGTQISFGVAQYFVALLEQFQYSWHWAFIIFGTFGTIFSILWYIVMTDSPLGNRYVRQEELEYLKGALPKPTTQEKIPVPWRALLECRAVRVHLLCMLAINFTVGLSSAFLPTYFKEEIRLPISSNGLFTAAPFVVQMVSKLGVGAIIDWRKRRGLSHTAAAKICQSIGTFGTAIFLVVLPLSREPLHCFVALLCFGATSSIAILGFYTTMTMIAPRFTGTVVSFILLIGALATLSSTLVFTAFNYYDFAWKYTACFGLAAVLQVAAGIAYLLWGSGEAQPWALEDSRSKDELLLSK